MTPSLSIDITVAGVGRIHRRSGVHTERERQALIAMLHELPKRGFRGFVVQIQRGERAMLAVYGHYAADTLPELAGPRLDRPVAPLVETWLDQADVAESTRQFRRDAWAATFGDQVGSGPTLDRIGNTLIERHCAYPLYVTADELKRSQSPQEASTAR